MIVSSASPEVRIVSAYSRCSVVSAVSSSRPLIPMIAFIGVRISWLIEARNALLARWRLRRSRASSATEQSGVLDGRPDAARERGQQLHVLLREAVVDGRALDADQRRSAS